MDMDYLTSDGSVLNFENAYYNYKSNEWEYKDDTPNGLIPESKLSELITEDEERRVALDYEREEMHKQKLYKKIGIF